MRRLLGTMLLVGVGGMVLSTLTLPVFRDMYEGPVVLPQTQPMRVPSQGTIPVNGPQILDRIEAEHRLTNPLPATPTVLEQGRELYDIYCGLCHGSKAEGDGQIAAYYRTVPELGSAYIQSYTDGWLYSIVREGGFNMPAYAESLSVNERWAVIHYVRTFGTVP